MTDASPHATSKGQRPDRSDRAHWLTGSFLLVAAVILWIPIVLVRLGWEVDFLEDLGFLSGPGGSAAAWILAIVVALAYSLFTVKNVPGVAQHWRRLSVLKALALLTAVGAAVVEEAVFRRMVMDSVAEAGGSALLQVLASGVVFGVAHGIWALPTRRLMVGIKATLATGSVGLALGVAYLVGGRSLAPPVVAHFLIDAVIQPGILLSAFGGRWE